MNVEYQRDKRFSSKGKIMIYENKRKIITRVPLKSVSRFIILLIMFVYPGVGPHKPWGLGLHLWLIYGV